MPAVGGQARSVGKFFVLRVAHLRTRGKSFTHNAMAGGAGTDSSARVIDIYRSLKRYPEYFPVDR